MKYRVELRVGRVQLFLVAFDRLGVRDSLVLENLRRYARFFPAHLRALQSLHVRVALSQRSLQRLNLKLEVFIFSHDGVLFAFDRVDIGDDAIDGKILCLVRRLDLLPRRARLLPARSNCPSTLRFSLSSARARISDSALPLSIATSNSATRANAPSLASLAASLSVRSGARRRATHSQPRDSTNSRTRSNPVHGHHRRPSA